MKCFVITLWLALLVACYEMFSYKPIGVDEASDGISLAGWDAVKHEGIAVLNPAMPTQLFTLNTVQGCKNVIILC